MGVSDLALGFVVRVKDVQRSFGSGFKFLQTTSLHALYLECIFKMFVQVSWLGWRAWGPLACEEDEDGGGDGEWGSSLYFLFVLHLYR
jgi:hypothetical protein